jgi:hypothetical protein
MIDLLPKPPKRQNKREYKNDGIGMKVAFVTQSMGLTTCWLLSA